MDKVINIAICDDDIIFLNELHKRVAEVLVDGECQYNIIKKHNGSELIEYCENNIVDIVLADIDMPDMTGFDAIQELQKEQPDLAVVFVTAHEEYAYQAYDYQPFWFVSKRHIERIGDVIKKLLRKIIYRKDEKECISVITDKVININIKETMYFKSDKHYVSAYRYDGQKIKFRAGIKEIYSQLADAGFINIHRSYIVNCRYIERFNYEYIVLKNGEKIPVTRKQETVKEAQKKYGEFMRKIRW